MKSILLFLIDHFPDLLDLNVTASVVILFILCAHGKILEQGTHQELLHQKGRYYHLYTLQCTKQQLNNS